METETKETEKKVIDTDNLYEYPILEGVMTDVPIYKDHDRGRNWLASIQTDKDAPNGLARKFAKAVHSGGYYMIDGYIELYDAIEFGADYQTTTGKRWPERWYGVIVEIDDNKIIIEKFSTALKAIRQSKNLKELYEIKEINEEVNQQINLKQIPTEQLVAELVRRGFTVKQDEALRLLKEIRDKKRSNN